MKAAIFLSIIGTVSAFVPGAPLSSSRCVASAVAMSTMADSGVPPTTSEPSTDVASEDIPTNLPSDCGMDYIPLATMLATGQLAEADQVRFVIIIEK